MLLGLGRHAVSTGDVADFNAVIGCSKFAGELFETRGAHET